MAKRLEHGILDRLINKNLLGKRKLGLPVKYHYDLPHRSSRTRIQDMIFFPKNKLEKFLSSIYERCLPGVKFFIWNPIIEASRSCGYTLQEKLFHSWFSSPNAAKVAMAQSIHPWGYLEGQRRDAFYRQTFSLMPGFDLPDWAQETKRHHDMDWNSILTAKDSFREVYRDSTPSPQIEPNYYFAINHYAMQHNILGYPAQRLFYNEDLRGDFYRNGYLTKSEKNIIHGFYGDSQGEHMRDRINGLSEEERVEQEQNAKKWDSLLNEFFPELQNGVRNPVLHRYEEAYYERNVDDIRSAYFTAKWMKAASEFTQDEVQKIYEFFLQDNTEAFFIQESAEEEAVPTDLYKKFLEKLDFPDFFEIDRFTTKPPEHQFYDLLDIKWGINFDVVDEFRNKYVRLAGNNTDSAVTSLIKEEVFNPFFRYIVQNKYGKSDDKSVVLAAIEQGATIKDLNELSSTARENTYLTNNKTLKQMVDGQVRKVVKTFHFKERVMV